MDDADGGRRGLRPRPGPEPWRALRSGRLMLLADFDFMGERARVVAASLEVMADLGAWREGLA